MARKTVTENRAESNMPPDALHAVFSAKGKSIFNRDPCQERAGLQNGRGSALPPP